MLRALLATVSSEGTPLFCLSGAERLAHSMTPDTAIIYGKHGRYPHCREQYTSCGYSMTSGKVRAFGNYKRVWTHSSNYACTMLRSRFDYPFKQFKTLPNL